MEKVLKSIEEFDLKTIDSRMVISESRNVLFKNLKQNFKSITEDDVRLLIFCWDKEAGLIDGYPTIIKHTPVVNDSVVDDFIYRLVNTDNVQEVKDLFTSYYNGNLEEYKASLYYSMEQNDPGSTLTPGRSRMYADDREADLTNENIMLILYNKDDAITFLNNHKELCIKDAAKVFENIDSLTSYYLHRDRKPINLFYNIKNKTIEFFNGNSEVVIFRIDQFSTLIETKRI